MRADATAEVARAGCFGALLAGSHEGQVPVVGRGKRAIGSEQGCVGVGRKGEQGSHLVGEALDPGHIGGRRGGPHLGYLIEHVRCLEPAESRAVLECPDEQ